MKTRVGALTCRGYPREHCYRPQDLGEGELVSVGASVPYVVLDVFTSRAYAGNPLAVVMDAEGLSGAQMQTITRQFNLSETAFPLTPSHEEREAGADYVLRIFTPGSEVPFAGHPSVGTAWWLAQCGRIPTGEVGQLCGEGLLPVEVTPTGATLTGGPPVVSAPRDPLLALAAVGLDARDLVRPDMWIASTGLPFGYVFVTDDALARCRPDITVLREEFAHPQPATGVYVVAWDSVRQHVRARMFAGDIGSAEDAATGSAALGLGALLAAEGELAEGAHEVTIDQGVEMGRPARLVVTCEVAAGAATRLRVTGEVVKVAEGRILVPPR
jgi:trans-2,3-dihydro-3-hydroxyanthranilate isomerase